MREDFGVRRIFIKFEAESKHVRQQLCLAGACRLMTRKSQFYPKKIIEETARTSKIREQSP